MKTILALGVPTLALWLLLGLLVDFKSATIAMVIACAFAAVIAAWVKFIVDNELW